MTPEIFFRKLVPEQWNLRLDEQLARGPAGAVLAGKMQEVAFGLEIRVAGESGGSFHLAVEQGRMRSVETPVSDPVVTLSLALAEWRRMAEEVGPRPMALIGGVGGTQDFVLTPARLAQLRALRGTIRLQVSGEDAWGVSLHFGPDPAPPEPSTLISLGSQEYRRLRAGDLDLQGAFMTGKLALAGDVESAMKLAVALMTPE